MSDQTNNFTLSKGERLKSKAIIDRLFSEGRSEFSFPIKLIYLPLLLDDPDDTLIKFGVTVPKRLHKKAHIRNLLKRRMREAYRLNKPKLIGQKKYAFMYILLDKSISDYASIEQSLIKLNKKIANKIKKIDEG